MVGSNIVFSGEDATSSRCPPSGWTDIASAFEGAGETAGEVPGVDGCFMVAGEMTMK